MKPQEIFDQSYIELLKKAYDNPEVQGIIQIHRRGRAHEEQRAQLQLLAAEIKKGVSVCLFGYRPADIPILIGNLKTICDIDTVVEEIASMKADGMTGLPMMSKEAHEKAVAKINSVKKYFIKLK